MIILTITYPFVAGSKFDEDYYRQKHMKMVTECWNPAEVTIINGRPGLDGSDPAFRLLLLVGFNSMEEVGAALQHPRGPELMADTANYTDTVPSLSVGEK